MQHFEAEAKRNQGKRNDLADNLVANLQRSERSSAKAAEMFNVSPRSVATAKKLMAEAPEDFKRVEAGEIARSGKITGTGER